MTGRLAELEARRAKLAERLAVLDEQAKAIRQATNARRVAADRKADAHRKIVTAGALMVLLRREPPVREYLARKLPTCAAERDRHEVEAFLAAAEAKK